MDNMIKNGRIKLTENFYLDEFVCKDRYGSFAHKRGDKFMMAVRMLQTARSFLGLPVSVTSGYRTWEHHEKIYKRIGKPAPKNSQHLKNCAFDVRPSKPKYRTAGILKDFAKYLKRAGFHAVVINFKRGFIHVDLGPKRTWNY